MVTNVGKMATALDQGVTWACWPVVKLLNFVLRPDPLDGSLGFGKVLVWLIVNGAALAAILLLVKGLPLLIALAAFLVLHVSIVSSSIRIMSQEKRVMEGTLDRGSMTLSATDAVNNLSILVYSTLFYVFGLAALIMLLEGSQIVKVLKSKPMGVPTQYGQYLACVLNEVPFVSTVLQTWANLADYSPNLNAEIIYSGIAGNAVRLLIILTVSVIAVRALVLRFQQATHQAAIADSIETRDADLETLHRRMVRVPAGMRDRLARMASSHPDLAVRERAKSAITKLKVIASPTAYLQALQKHAHLPDVELKAVKEALAAVPANVVKAIPTDLIGKVDQRLREKAGSLGKEAMGLVDDIKGLLGGKKAP